MIHSKLCAIAETVIVDQQGNASSIINLYEGAVAAGFPFVLPKLTVFILWERDVNDPPQYQGLFTLRVGTQDLINQTVNIDFLDQHRARSIIQMAGVLIPGPCTVISTFQLAAQSVEVQYSFDITGNPAPTVVTAG